MANKKINQLVSKTSILSTDIFGIGDATTGQLFKKTIAELQAAIGGAVISVNGLVGTVVLDTDDIQELASPTNKYFTDARARGAISLTVTGSSGASTYSSGTGVLNVPTYTLAGLGGISATFLSGTSGVSYNSTTGVISYSGTVFTDASIRALFSGATGITYNSSTGAISYNGTVYTDASIRALISITTTGTSGASTYNNTTGVINVPNYTLAGLGGITASFLSGTSGISYNSTTGAISYSGTVYTDASVRALISATGNISYNNTTGVISTSLTQYTDALARASVSLTTTGTSGASTYNSTTGVFNIPQYAAALSGTTNYISKFTSGTAIGISQIFDNGTNVGIGTISPSVPLEVNGNIRSTRSGAASQYLQIEGGDPVGAFVTAVGVAKVLTIRNNSTVSSRIVFEQTVASSYFFRQAGTDTVAIDSAGYLGIGTATPLYPLHTVTTATSIAAFKNSGAATGQILVGNTAGDLALRILASGDALIFADTSKYLAFGSNGGTERMRLTSGGNLLVGTTTDSGDRVNISGTFRSTALWTLSGGITHWGNGTTAYGGLTWDTGYATIYATGGNVLNFGANGSSAKMTLNTSGNLGLGVTPSASSNIVAFDISTIGGVFADGFSQNNQVGISANAYRAGAAQWYYKITSPASYYAQDLGSHKWFSAINGTAGTAISFTQAMTLASTGNLLIGQTGDDGYKLQVNGVSRSKGEALLGNFDNLTDFGQVGIYSTSSSWADGFGSLVLSSRSDAARPIIFTTYNGSSLGERMRLTSGGNLLVGTTTDAGYKLDVNGTGRFSGALTGTSATFSSSVTASSLIKSGGTSAQYLMADGSVSTLTNNITGTGTTNYIPKFTSGSALGLSQFFDNGTQVGIGTASPIGFASDDRVLQIHNSAVSTSASRSMLRFTNSFSGATFLNGSLLGIDSSLDLVIVNTEAASITFSTSDIERGRITSGGNWLLGTSTNNGERLYVSGDIRATGTITANSDIRIKSNITKIENALEKVGQISGYTYNTNYDEKRHGGVIAQEIDKVFPEIVNTGNDGLMGVEYGNISALLIEAIKEQKKEIDELRTILASK